MRIAIVDDEEKERITLNHLLDDWADRNRL